VLLINLDILRLFFSQDTKYSLAHRILHPLFRSWTGLFNTVNKSPGCRLPVRAQFFPPVTTGAAVVTSRKKAPFPCSRGFRAIPYGKSPSCRFVLRQLRSISGLFPARARSGSRDKRPLPSLLFLAEPGDPDGLANACKQSGRAGKPGQIGERDARTCEDRTRCHTTRPKPRVCCSIPPCLEQGGLHTSLGIPPGLVARYA
jgi:hypothetical protein